MRNTPLLPRPWLSPSTLVGAAIKDGYRRYLENRIREALDLGDVKMFVVACPKDTVMYTAAVQNLGLKPHGYVVAFSTTQAHKNLAVLFEAFRRPELADVTLVLVGGTGIADYAAAAAAHAAATPAPPADGGYGATTMDVAAVKAATEAGARAEAARVDLQVLRVVLPVPHHNTGYAIQRFREVDLRIVFTDRPLIHGIDGHRQIHIVTLDTGRADGNLGQQHGCTRRFLSARRPAGGNSRRNDGHPFGGHCPSAVYGLAAAKFAPRMQPYTKKTGKPMTASAVRRV